MWQVWSDSGWVKQRGCEEVGGARYILSEPVAKPSPSDAPRSWAAHPTYRQPYHFAPRANEASSGTTKAEFQQAEAVPHDLHVRGVTWHASRTSRGGLRSRTLLSTRHVMYVDLKRPSHPLRLVINDASRSNGAISSTSPSPLPRHAQYTNYAHLCKLTSRQQPYCAFLSTLLGLVLQSPLVVVMTLSVFLFHVQWLSTLRKRQLWVHRPTPCLSAGVPFCDGFL